MVQHCRDACEQLAVDGRSVENVVDVGTVTIDLLGKPGYGATARLTVKDFFDGLSDVSHKLKSVWGDEAKAGSAAKEWIGVYG